MPNGLRALLLLLVLAAAGAARAAAGETGTTPALLECAADDQAQERFLPVELLNGLPLPQVPELKFLPVDRSYSYVAGSPDGKVWRGETELRGPVSWVGAGGVTYEVYERKVPQAHERFALVAGGDAIGRVYDQRWGNSTNEGKFPVGLWKQGETRSYDMIYHTSRGESAGQTSIEIVKLSCVYDDVPGAVQYRWRATRGNLDYEYIYVPGRGLAQVYVRSAGRF